MKKKSDPNNDRVRKLIAEQDLKRLIGFGEDYYKQARMAYLYWRITTDRDYEIAYRRNAKKAVEKYHESVKLYKEIKEIYYGN